MVVAQVFQNAVDCVMSGVDPADEVRIYTLRYCDTEEAIFDGSYEDCVSKADELGLEIGEDAWIETVVMGFPVEVTDEDPT
jgi:hypothetical protein